MFARTSGEGFMGAVRRQPPSARLGRQAFDGLERWLYSAQSATFGLHEVEVEEERRGREALRLLFQAHVDMRGDGDVGEVLEFTDGKAETAVLYTHRRLHSRRLITVFGPVSVTRVAYGRPGRPSLHPLDAVLQLPGRSLSYELQRRLLKAAVKGPFDEALEVVAEFTGVVVSKRTAEDLVREASHDFESFYERRRGTRGVKIGPILVASIDSKGIPMVKTEGAEKKVRRGRGEKRQKKRMATVAAVFTQDPDVRTPKAVLRSLFSETRSTRKRRPRRPQQKRVWASLLADKEAFIAAVKEEMLRRDRRRRKTWVVVTDGERGLQRRVTESLDGDFTFVLDFLHVLEKLWAASYVFHPEGSLKAQRFVEERALHSPR